VETLKKGEEIALMDYDFGANMSQRWFNFRNALIHVAVENPLPGPVAAQPMLLPGEAPPMPLHVMIVDDSPHVLTLHSSLIRYFQPDARVHTCTSVPEAVTYWEDCKLKSDQVHLVLLDFNFNLECDGEESVLNEQQLFQSVVEAPNGLDVASALDKKRPDAQTDFMFRPLIALVTSYANRMRTDLPEELVGKVQQCDLLLPKPMNARWARVLIECCAV